MHIWAPDGRRNPAVREARDTMNRSIGMYLLAGTVLVAAINANALTHPRGGYHVLGAGATSCESWTKAGRSRPLAEAYLQWVLGYITAIYGLDVIAGSDVTGGIDADGVQTWIDNYCAQHPVELVVKAAEEISKELIARQKH